MFIAAATDDQLGMAPEKVALYEKWTDAHKSAELHMYAKGGHGFGMHKHDLPNGSLDRPVRRLAGAARIFKEVIAIASL
jgi:acetyl esterase/lipase